MTEKTLESSFLWEVVAYKRWSHREAWRLEWTESLNGDFVKNVSFQGKRNICNPSNVKISLWSSLITVMFSECRQFRVSIEFSLEHPEGGIQFVIPKGEDTMAQVHLWALNVLWNANLWHSLTQFLGFQCILLQRSAHLFTYGCANSSR